MRLFLIALFLLTACGSHDEKSPAPDPRVDSLQQKFAITLQEARSVRDPKTGWLTGGDCDGMLWDGKYASVTCDVDIETAEDAFSPGRFYRSNEDRCRTSLNPDWSTWSRDMGVGLLAWAWRCKRLDVLQRHASYGKAHNWKMGEPLGDGRSLYTPSFIGKLYETIFALGGEDNPGRLWPDIYTSGLTDYQAHLQVMNIWHRGEVSGFENNHSADAKPNPVVDEEQPWQPLGLLEITGTMLDRLKEHAARDPRDPLFQAVLGRYTGDMAPALTRCLAEDGYFGEYARCDNGGCKLAAWIFACDLVLRAYK